MPHLLEMINVLGSHFWLTCFLINFQSFLLNCTSTILILISILVFFFVFFCFMFAFPLLGEKQRFKFLGWDEYTLYSFYQNVFLIFLVVLL